MVTLLSQIVAMSPSPFTFVPVFIALALHITGCSSPLSPEAQCFADATIAYRAAWREARAVRADLDRGYALHEETVPVVQAVACRFEGARRDCLYQGRQVVSVPVAIDRRALGDRLTVLEAEMAALKPAAMAAAAPCGYSVGANTTLADATSTIER